VHTENYAPVTIQKKIPKFRENFCIAILSEERLKKGTNSRLDFLFLSEIIMGKAPKSTKKFQKNHLKRTVEQRRVEQKHKQKLQINRKKNVRKGDGDTEGKVPGDQSEQFFDNKPADEFFDGELDIVKPKKKKKSRKQEHEDDDLDGEEQDASSAHRADLKNLAETDPEFYKYLQNNDQELLDFDEDEEEEDDSIFGGILVVVVVGPLQKAAWVSSGCMNEPITPALYVHVRTE
jgi:hypothetical protein